MPLVFKKYFEKLGTDDRLNKSDFHIIVEHIEPQEIDGEVIEALDLIVEQGKKAKPRSS